MAKAPWITGYRKATEKGKARAGYTHHNSHGWVPTSDLAKAKDMPTRTVTLPNGEEVQVYDGGYDEYLGHQFTGEAMTESMDTYIASSFNKTAVSKNYVTACNGVGHIAYLEYNSMRQVLRVTFRIGGRVCVFFRVPSGVASELFRFCDASYIDNSRKSPHNHLLGIRFWDLIRIRGTRGGAKYKFVYTNEAQRLPVMRDTAAYSVVKRYDQNATLDQIKQGVDLDSAWKAFKKSNEAFLYEGMSDAERKKAEAALDDIASKAWNGDKQNLYDKQSWDAYNALETYEERERFLFNQRLLTDDIEDDVNILEKRNERSDTYNHSAEWYKNEPERDRRKQATAAQRVLDTFLKRQEAAEKTDGKRKGFQYLDVTKKSGNTEEMNINTNIDANVETSNKKDIIKKQANVLNLIDGAII